MSLPEAMLDRVMMPRLPVGLMRMSYFSPVTMTDDGSHVSPYIGAGKPVRSVFHRVLSALVHSLVNAPLNVMITRWPI